MYLGWVKGVYIQAGLVKSNKLHAFKFVFTCDVLTR